MSKPVAATWVCPICGRRVPKRERECFCGAKQDAAQQHHAQEAEKKSRRVPMDVALLLLALVGLGVYGVHRVTRDAEPEPAEGQPVAVVAASQEPRREAPPVPPVPAAPVQAPVAQPADSRPFEPAPAQPSLEPARLVTPAPADPGPTPAPVDERAQVRAAGLAAYEAALQRLEGVARGIDSNLRAYVQGCGGDTQRFVPITNCEEIEAAVRRDVTEVVRGLDAAEDEARRAWLDPGQVRAARGRSVFGTRQWDEVMSLVQKLRR